ncbi:MAG: hypothetical protein EOP48_13300 [Sphingobacteriales bacterium]|nr:MAG: hypothetical protein EOP48_13300 [Sphingobacteriales bacterium]
MYRLFQKLEAALNKEFGHESAYWNYSIIDVGCNLPLDTLLISVSHYSNQEKYFQLSFSEVLSYRVTQESFLVEDANENYIGSHFFGAASRSKYKDFVLTTYPFKDIYPSINFDELECWRIVGQNLFVDIFSLKKPEIIIPNL